MPILLYKATSNSTDLKPDLFVLLRGSYDPRPNNLTQLAIELFLVDGGLVDAGDGVGGAVVQFAAFFLVGDDEG